MLAFSFFKRSLTAQHDEVDLLWKKALKLEYYGLHLVRHFQF